MEVKQWNTCRSLDDLPLDRKRLKESGTVSGTGIKRQSQVMKDFDDFHPDSIRLNAKKRAVDCTKDEPVAGSSNSCGSRTSSHSTLQHVSAVPVACPPSDSHSESSPAVTSNDDQPSGVTAQMSSLKAKVHTQLRHLPFVLPDSVKSEWRTRLKGNLTSHDVVVRANLGSAKYVAEVGKVSVTRCLLQ